MANIIDIAKKTGLSASTVSRTLTRPEKVAAATRERVMKAIDELGYEANIFARNLRQGGRKLLVWWCLIFSIPSTQRLSKRCKMLLIKLVIP